MHSRHKYHLVKVEAREDQIIDEEEESHKEVEETSIQPQVEGVAIIFKLKAQANTKHKEKGMINPKSNFTIVKSMGIMRMNVERNKIT